jgi:putative flavoprotein involved in K+ transport
MQYIPAIIIGAGQAGLAMSHCLGRRRIDHVVLERGQIAERWRGERWDTLRLLTPNWMSRLPDWSYRGDHPDGFMTAPEFVGYLAAYARASRAPVEAGVAVQSVRPTSRGYRVETGRGVWEAPVVVIATGHCDVPRVPALAQRLPGWLRQITPSEYRNPDQLPDGAVLVVGASATGIQLAAEIRRGATRDCRGATEGAILGGGSNGSACSTRRRLRFRTCGAPAPNLLFSSWAGQTVARSTSEH